MVVRCFSASVTALLLIKRCPRKQSFKDPNRKNLTMRDYGYAMVAATLPSQI